jgi:hypothetical protein
LPACWPCIGCIQVVQRYVLHDLLAFVHVTLHSTAQHQVRQCQQKRCCTLLKQQSLLLLLQ